ncbi:RcnB family protein [Pseudomonas entomophila]|jgi:Ni/Co efflux regulator RcnB|uniref:RcnB family protein n=1 Tax=Pseudomonas entomophila TaxID=312306 RepID=UPI0015E44034|nr:RcnB family protein [Pseudomonas entomophila]MBA1192775.1 RcnB family protein [Pseudomonas entomophila]
MNTRHLLSALLLTGTFACLPMAAQAADAGKSDETIQSDQTRNRELEVGDKAPDQYKRDEAAIKDWKAKGLKAPEDEVSHWVNIDDHYVLVQITNGVIMEIVPKKK